MKYAIYSLLILFLVSCNSKDTTVTTDKTHPALIGSYISVNYLNALDTTKSTLRSQQYAGLSSATIKAKGDTLLFIADWNFHEGGTSYFIKMTSEKSGGIFSDTADTMQSFSIEITSDSTIKVFNAKDTFMLKKVSNAKGIKDYSKIINQHLVPKTFLLNGKPVDFRSDGSVHGIDSLTAFNFTLDYYDAGMDYDKINLTFKNCAKPIEYGYAISTDTFEIYSVQCNEFDKYDTTICLSHIKKSTVYKMYQKKK